MPPKAKRVFISSTAKDLKDHRRQVDLAIERLGQAAVRMEAFTADPGTPVEVCKEKVGGADLLVVIVAHRYGWVPTTREGGDGEKSITWLEVEAAEQKRPTEIPVLAFLVDPKHPWAFGTEQDDLKGAKTPEDASTVFGRVQSLERFKQHLSNRVADHFTTPNHLAALVATALAQWLGSEEDQRTATGFVKYFQALERRTSHISIQGIASAPGRAKAAGRYPIEHLYAPLRSRRVGEAGTAVQKGKGKKKVVVADRGESVSLAKLLPEQSRLLIEGQPGAGKSTFLRLVACMLSRDRLGTSCPGGTSWSSHHLGLAAAAPFPVLVALGELVPLMRNRGRVKRRRRKELWLLDLIDEQRKRDEIRVSRKRFEEILKAGEAILLLDGMDEVADPDLRREVLEVVRDAAVSWPSCPIVVTSRPIDTAALRDEGFHHATIEPFDLRGIEDFIRLWVTALYGESATDAVSMPTEAREYLKELSEAVTGRSRIRQIASNPVMLTCLCVVHWNEGRLPEGKSRVYAAVLRWLLEARREQRELEGYSQHFAQKALARLALAMMRTPAGKQSSIDLGAAATAIDDVVHREWSDLSSPEDRAHRARAWLRFESLGSGVIEEVGGNRIRFWHLTFQEYFAALQLSWLQDGDAGEACWWPIVKERLADAQWRETADLLPGCLLDKGDGPVDTLLKRVLEQDDRRDGLAALARGAGIVARLLNHVQVYGYLPKPVVQTAYEQALDDAMAIFEPSGADQVQVDDRIAAAVALGQGGDPRLDSFEANLLPIPKMPEILLGKYLVTVEEFQEFCDDRGYDRPELWSEEGWSAKELGDWRAPADWAKQLEKPNLPVVGVSWHEAAAYCSWRTNLSNRTVRLPTNDEWLAASTPAKGRYPWGTTGPSPKLANYNDIVGAPTPVGIYPRGAGPGGHLDLAGNVREWGADNDDELDPDQEGRRYAILLGSGWDAAASDLSLRPEKTTWAPTSLRRFEGFRVSVPQEASPS